MTPDLFQTARELFEQACEFSLEERKTLLDERCGEDAELRREVERLLALDHTPHPGFERSPVSELADETRRLDAGRMPARVGPYETVRVLGVGGAGIVYEAAQPSLGRPVALKLLRTLFDSDELCRRFRTVSCW